MLVNEQIDALNLDFYDNIAGPYWDEERKHIDNEYVNIDFPFVDIESKSFEVIKEWDLKTLEGFFNTWSAVQHFIKKEGYNPVPKFIASLKLHWQDGEKKTIRFPVFLKLARLG